MLLHLKNQKLTFQLGNNAKTIAKYTKEKSVDMIFPNLVLGTILYVTYNGWLHWSLRFFLTPILTYIHIVYARAPYISNMSYMTYLTYMTYMTYMTSGI